MAETFDSTGSIDDLLGALEAAAPSPAGGTAAAVAAAMAASLVTMVARNSPAWPDGAAVAQRASTARDRLLVLGAEDVQAFAGVLAAARESVAESLADALVHAAEIPLEIAGCAADVVELATATAAAGKRPLRPDAEAAAILASAATRAAALLVGVNLEALPGNQRDEEKASLMAAAQAAITRTSL